MKRGRGEGSDAPRFDDPSLRGLAEAARRFGIPFRQAVPGLLAVGRPGGRRTFARRRQAEIVLVVLRPGGVLLHTKSFYPPGAFRLLSGGVGEGEHVVEAAARELYEETGLSVPPVRLLFHVLYRLEVEGREKAFHSLGFLYPETDAPVAPTDPEEDITALRDVSWEELPAVAALLEGLDDDWRTWGRFRAIPHRVLLDLHAAHPGWFESRSAAGGEETHAGESGDD